MDAATRTKNPKNRPSFVTVPSSAICHPGVYVTQHGHMFRLFEALMEDEGPVVGWDRIGGTLVTRITEDPRLPIETCRQVATQAGLPVRF
jgi:hypothetical protein